ncbi:hypothetical protein PCASD_13395 [Puccinia coronata f. sp. avenae]|uniref:GAF domain-containing protein n=1 Tax=Puccinia coronata f. sp. avenae TaxID=200324 RepID=A0A2N5T0S4_9BASI|nr:hypothetical protein PCASD_13395 [Puccinia coronata f. sp. avenae]
MALIIACPRGITLPYSSIFNVGLRHTSSRMKKSRPAEYFWKKATSNSPSEAAPQRDQVEESNDGWFDSTAPPFSDSEDESPANINNAPKETYKKRLIKIRRIVFKSFVPKLDGAKSNKNVMMSTEVVCHDVSSTPKGKGRRAFLTSWKFKSNGTKSQVHKMVAKLKPRISVSSPADHLPKTWDEYDYWYSNEQIDILNPPLPPMESEEGGGPPSAFTNRFYMAPLPAKEKVRQLVVNRLGVFGDKGFDAGDEATARAKVRTYIGDKLLEEGKVPESLDESWERCDSVVTEKSGMSVQAAGGMLDSASRDSSLPETLEQHPIFRKIVKQCRELFRTDFSMLSVLDEDRQIFLAESGGGGQRDTPRDIGFCAHTILSGRKGFAILDTHNDWRFENSPLTQHWNSRFYAGVPLLSPNLDGSQESDDNVCAIGTLCIVDPKPRESFTVEERKKFVYMGEYARREIEKWFAKKMEQKMQKLTASQERWTHELERAVSSSSDGDKLLQSEVRLDATASPERTTALPKRSGSKRLPRISLRPISPASTSPATSPSSYTHTDLKSPTKPGPGLFEDVNEVVKPNMRIVFDLATKLIGETLQLSLVYLAAVTPHGESNGLGQLMILSGYNIPLPVPVFDAGLHLRALRAPEGGCLYQNPSVEESEEASFQPKGSGTQPYASAMLVAVGSEAQPNSGGFVLTGYTDDRKRVFGAEDVDFIKKIANEISKYTSTLQL